MLTDYHVKLFAHELYLRQPSDGVERFISTLMGSQVDLNPHQIEAAVFAFRSPLSNGVIFADEVGLGKTIEAGIVISQKWYEKKRKILLIMPASLRKQWHHELFNKFNLPSIILDSKSFNIAIRENTKNPFDQDTIIICSFHFANNKNKFIRAIKWDLVIIDEAHWLRNVYKKENKIARELKDILKETPKLLLTATPLQNSLDELFGLVSFIDEHIFGDLKSFRKQFKKNPTEVSLKNLKNRINPICKRTLRSQVLEYIKYTERKTYTQEFIPTDQEKILYDMVVKYIQRPKLFAIPDSQRNFIALILLKLLASSTVAIAPALEAMASRLQRLLESDKLLTHVDEELIDDFESFEDIADELVTDEQDESVNLKNDDRNNIQLEINDLKKFSVFAKSIAINAKGESLVKALKVGFKMTAELGGLEKAIIFTESRRTQKYLVELLSRAGYEDDIVLFNGSNSDVKSRKIYLDWKQRYQGTNVISGSRSADSRAALVEYFYETAKIMIATEAAAEGINLQFCSMVVNYDLPWNPQRIEQRIGRCHRYGQKHDVVIINFLNTTNAADKRVYQLLSDKLGLFSGIFGASNEVLGLVESDINFERRIVEIYQTCRSTQEIEASFDSLQAELAIEIDENMQSARHKLLENFDHEVAKKLKICKEKVSNSSNKYESLLWNCTRYLLYDSATFYDTSKKFELHISPNPKIIPTGSYVMEFKDKSSYHYHIQHPLANFILNEAMNSQLPIKQLVFEYSKNDISDTFIKSLVGKEGIMTINILTVSSINIEDYMIIVAITDNYEELDSCQTRKLFDLPSYIEEKKCEVDTHVLDVYEKKKSEISEKILHRKSLFINEEMKKLERWSNDKQQYLKSILINFDNKVLDLKIQARSTLDQFKRQEIEKKLKETEIHRNNAWDQYNESITKIENEKARLIDETKKKMEEILDEKHLFTVRWRVI